MRNPNSWRGSRPSRGGDVGNAASATPVIAGRGAVAGRLPELLDGAEGRRDRERGAGGAGRRPGGGYPAGSGAARAAAGPGTAARRHSGSP
ncbi:hypothetical protein LUX33_08355 [Actinomadura madurae]|uniref:hypothetical protein n=1 Tax=Actinomadura madurae TaxID=1993 RepID=UPI0020D217FB|nr:hypothetical protein [Actinomadura madurae]MCP9948425.1 hypothetical protein [Actinomadura madurae]